MIFFDGLRRHNPGLNPFFSGSNRFPDWWVTTPRGSFETLFAVRVPKPQLCCGFPNWWVVTPTGRLETRLPCRSFILNVLKGTDLWVPQLAGHEPNGRKDSFAVRVKSDWWVMAPSFRIQIDFTSGSKRLACIDYIPFFWTFIFAGTRNGLPGGSGCG